MIPALQGDRTSLLQTILPEDPENGQTVEMPDGHTVGGANVISVHKGGKFCGTVSQVAPVYNSSGKYEATRLSSCVKLRIGDVVRVLGWQYNFISLKFVEGFGWQGYKTDNKPLSLMDKSMRVLEAFTLGEHAPGYYLYEKVCLTILREGETHAKNTNFYNVFRDTDNINNFVTR